MNVVNFQEARERKLSAGFCPIPNDLVEALAAGKLTAREFQVVAAVIRKTYGWGKDSDRIAASQLAELTGIRRQECSMLLCRLIERNIISRQGGSRGPIQVNLNSAEWTEREKASKDNISGRVTTDSELSSLTTTYSHRVTTNVRHTIDKKDTLNTPSEYSPSEAEEPAAPVKAQKPNCPVQEIVALYHEVLPELRECRVLNESRRKLIRGRFREHKKLQTLDGWRGYFETVRRSDFLMGLVQSRDGRPPFQADLEWLVGPKNFAKVVEGKYEN